MIARGEKGRGGGFTVIELLVVIAIISILVAMLVPAVQQVRESASLTRCSNNLRQMGIGMHACHDMNGRFPSGGWGWNWLGIPDRGVGVDQPGGWLFNLLPFVEQTPLRDLARDLTPGSAPWIAAMSQMAQTPVDIFNCPSRRNAAVFADATGYWDGVGGKFTTGQSARTDYGANAGNQKPELFAGPNSLAQGDNPGYSWPSVANATGIFFQRSQIRAIEISRGTSNTYMIGEKYIDAGTYLSGGDPGDNECMFVGYDNDVYRSTGTQYPPPMRDQKGVKGGVYTFIFGGPHAYGFNMLWCDGSVRMVAWGVDPVVHRESGCRMDPCP